MKRTLPDILSALQRERNHSAVKKRISSLLLARAPNQRRKYSQYVSTELRQILDARTLERAQYYIRRLIRGLTEVKTGKMNDLNLNRWKEYDDLLTDSLWLLDRRDRSGSHTAEYWGNFIPQIPNQLIRRFTKKGEWVLDPFLGSGTSLIECRNLGRNGIGIELQSSIVKQAKKRIIHGKNPHSVQTEVVVGDSTQLDLKRQIQSAGISSVQLAIVHPPYWDIIRFSKNSHDLSNAGSLQKFLLSFGQVIENVDSALDRHRCLAVIIGDKYCKSEWIPLGFLTMQEVLKRNYKLKSIIIKNFKETKAKRAQEELWRYRAFVGGFYVFKHEYIFLFQKK